MGLSADFWRGRRVLLTGHTGFKGAWLALWLERLGAEVTGIALPPDTHPSLFEVLEPWPRLVSVLADLREAGPVVEAVERARPDVVFHLAAQALVRRGYAAPVETFAVNVVGTAVLLEALRKRTQPKAIVVVTSDKAYANDDAGRPFTEADRLGGRDPYSASKASQELVAQAWRQSFFADNGPALATARAGNVIGGGDWAVDRLMADLFRALAANRAVRVRNPEATRPWQHVLEPLAGYLLLAEALAGAKDVPPALNFGPDPKEVRPVRWVVEQVLARWGDGAGWTATPPGGPPEAAALVLNPRLAGKTLGWRPRLDLDEALDWTVEWHRAHRDKADVRALSIEQIERYMERLV
jgi:CDP-glucose 4,6-dehydratase